MGTGRPDTMPDATGRRASASGQRGGLPGGGPLLRAASLCVLEEEEHTVTQCKPAVQASTPNVRQQHLRPWSGSDQAEKADMSQGA